MSDVCAELRSLLLGSSSSFTSLKILIRLLTSTPTTSLLLLVTLVFSGTAETIRSSINVVVQNLEKYYYYN